MFKFENKFYLTFLKSLIWSDFNTILWECMKVRKICSLYVNLLLFFLLLLLLYVNLQTLSYETFLRNAWTDIRPDATTLYYELKIRKCLKSRIFIKFLDISCQFKKVNSYYKKRTKDYSIHKHDLKFIIASTFETCYLFLNFYHEIYNFETFFLLFNTMQHMFKCWIYFYLSFKNFPKFRNKMSKRPVLGSNRVVSPFLPIMVRSIIRRLARAKKNSSIKITPNKPEQMDRTNNMHILLFKCKNE